MLLTVLRSLAICVGALAYYAAFFMYEDEEGKWQNRIEKLWVAINDREKLGGGSQASAFFNKVADVATRGFNRALGRRLFSVQLVGVSTSYSYAALFLGFSFGAMILTRPSRLVAPLPEAAAISLVTHFVLILGMICLFLAVLPALVRSRWTVALSLLPLGANLFGFMGLTMRHTPLDTHAAALLALVLSLLSDVLLLALVRLTVRRVSAKPSVSRIAIAILIQLGIIVLLVVTPWETVGRLRGAALTVVVGVAVFNVFTGLASSVFLLMLLFVLLHKAIWPILGKLFYALARHQVIRNRKIMASVGTGCFIFAWPLMSRPVASVLRWLAE
jgi:hypothetical protein